MLDGTRVMSGKKEQVIFNVQNDPRFNRLKIITFGILTIFEFAFARERAYANMNFSKNKLKSRPNDARLLFQAENFKLLSSCE